MAEYTLQQAWDDKNKDRQARKVGGQAFERWKTDQTPESLRQVVQELQPAIDSAVSHYLGPKASPALKTRARLLAAQAVKTYDPERGASLPTYVNQNLRALQRLAPQVTDPLAPSERFRREQMEIRQATDLLSEQLHRDPTDEEVSDLVGLPLKRVSKVRSRMRARIPFSVYEEGGEDDDDLDVPAEERTEFDDWVDAVYEDLGPVDRLIMMHRTGYRNADVLPNVDIAHRLNMTPAAVSQRASRIQNRIDQYYAAS